MYKSVESEDDSFGLARTVIVKLISILREIDFGLTVTLEII